MKLTPAALSAIARGDLPNALVATTPGGIERQEAAGQQKLVASTDMPIDLSPGKEAFEKLGFTFADKIDEIFQRATLPIGWSRRATGHSMHSEIVDAQERVRVSVFYKAAFYDRRADAHLVRRFKVDTLYGDYDDSGSIKKGEVCALVKDQGKEIYRTPVCRDSNRVAGKDCAVDAIAWLEERYPLWDDPTAYWEDAP